MNLAIDIGNTRTKIGIFSDGELKDLLVGSLVPLLTKVLKEVEIDQVIVSSVGDNARRTVTELTSGLKVLYFDADTQVPIKNLYHTPQTLGMDRLAGVVGARELFPEQPLLVIDAGTSITYDFLDHHGSYHGGGISPGIDLRFKSLHDYTSRLPLINSKSIDTPLIGQNTEMSIRSGVLNGATAEIEGIIRRYDHKFTTLKVLLCGGDATFFERTIKAPIFVVPHLVLIGLNRILLHHAQI